MTSKNITLDNHKRDLKFCVGTTDIEGFISKQDVVNFLGLPFARIPARFRTAEQIDFEAGILCARNYGSRCPQLPDPIHSLQRNVFEQLSSFQRQDEYSCLHLNIYTPLSILEEQVRSKLPVFVFIHGGAFNNGDNTTEFDGNHLVNRSVSLGKPIIVVTINYRLNAFGFSASRELIEEAETLGETPILNQGLNDQRIGLQWIQDNIHNFGGDNLRVTLGGESAGAISVICHLHGRQPLFQQAMIQSPPGFCLGTLEKAQILFDKLVESSGVSSQASGADKLAAVRALSTDEVLNSFAGAVTMPIEDPNWFVPDTCSSEIGLWGEIPDWCPKVIIGYTADEAALFLVPLQDTSEHQVTKLITSVNGFTSMDDLTSKYGTSTKSLIAWVTEHGFARPISGFSLRNYHKKDKSVYLYSIDLVDPFPGPLNGYAWHSWGVPLTFCQPPGRAWPQISASQDQMSIAHIDFFYGLQPWEPSGVAGRQMSWNGEASGLVLGKDCNEFDPRLLPNNLVKDLLSSVLAIS